MYKTKIIAVVIPIYNEERLIVKTIHSVPSYVDFIVAVDDQSTDYTFDALKKCQKTMPKRLVILQNEVNQGCGGALATGYKWVRDQHIDIAVRMDGDGQMDPSDLTSLLDPVVEEDVDYAKGNRLFTGEAYNKIPRVRYFGNAVLSFLTKIASGYWQVADSQTGYTVISRRALLTIDWDKMYKRYGQPNDLLVRLNVCNFKVRDVPVKPIYNVGEKSNMKIRVVTFTISWLLFKLFLWRLKEKYIIRDFHPLIFFYLLGFLLIFASMILFARAVIVKFFIGYFPPITLLSWMFSVSIGFQSLFFAMWFDMDYHRDLR
ncbi:MAG: glycosyltransferase family 2 protein [Candidatus Omnitrophica bacterium]|nr:glycosyltransferase family 2 protein [Candidatus Omnitrophota bacterium]